MIYTVLTTSLALGMFIDMLLVLELGGRIGQRPLMMDPGGARAGVGVVEIRPA